MVSKSGSACCCGSRVRLSGEPCRNSTARMTWCFGSLSRQRRCPTIAGSCQRFSKSTPGPTDHRCGPCEHAVSSVTLAHGLSSVTLAHGQRSVPETSACGSVRWWKSTQQPTTLHLYARTAQLCALVLGPDDYHGLHASSCYSICHRRTQDI